MSDSTTPREGVVPLLSRVHAQGAVDLETHVVSLNIRQVGQILDALSAHKACVEALRTIAYGAVPRKSFKLYRADGQASRFDRCDHDVVHDGDCGACTSNFAAATLDALEKANG